jgi:hypothetical protein
MASYPRKIPSRHHNENLKFEKCASPVATTFKLAHRVQYICGNALKPVGTVGPKQYQKFVT